MSVSQSQAPKRLSNAQVGMLVTLASFTMLFGTLLLAYLLIRARQSYWPPIGTEPLDKGISTLSTMVVLMSSVAVHFALKAFESRQFARFKNYWTLGHLGGLAFMILQGIFLYQMWQTGHRVSDGLFASVSYTLIIVHGLHVLVAWAWLLFVELRARMGVYEKNPQAQNPVLAAWFWHFLGIVWLFTCALLVWY